MQAVTSQPNLLTNPPGLPIEGSYTLAEWATPLDPGELIDRVPDAACGQANQLLNPIDNSCITVDALGNPRVDANGKRNIGAVQLILAPYLTVVGTGDGTVDLSWTKPQFSAPATRSPAMSCATVQPARRVGRQSSPRYRSRHIGASGHRSDQRHRIRVRSTRHLLPSGEGPWSNTATGTPLGPIGAPVVTATPGNGQVDLDWTKPADGGHVIDAYSILWRRGRHYDLDWRYGHLWRGRESPRHADDHHRPDQRHGV